MRRPSLSSWICLQSASGCRSSSCLCLGVPVLLFVASSFLVDLSASCIWESAKGFCVPGGWMGRRDTWPNHVSGASYKWWRILGVGLISVWLPYLWWSHSILCLVSYKGILSQKHPVVSLEQLSSSMICIRIIGWTGHLCCRIGVWSLVRTFRLTGSYLVGWKLLMLFQFCNSESPSSFPLACWWNFPGT